MRSTKGQRPARRGATTRENVAQELPPDRLSFPNPDSTLGRLVAKERRAEPTQVVLRVEWSEEQERRAGSTPARHIWKKTAPPPNTEKYLGVGTDAELFLSNLLQILEEAPIKRRSRSDLVPHDKVTDLFRNLVGLLLTTRGYHNWLVKHGEAEAAPLLQEITKQRETLRRARLRLRQASYIGAKQSTWYRAHADSIVAGSLLRTKTEELNSLRTGLPEPPAHHVMQLRHAAAIGIVHELYHDYGLPDATITALLRAVGLPPLSPRTIKRLRTDYRRP